MKCLSANALAALPDAVARPRYDRAALQPGIVHLGIGAFMRAHLAVATEAAIDADGDPRWGIVGVSLRHGDTRDALAPQDGLYTLALRDADEAGRARQRLQVIGCVLQVRVAPEDPAAVLAAIAASATRIVSLSVTEKGYAHDPATRALNFGHPDIVHDLAHPDAPRSAAGFIVRGLARRRAAGLAPLTLLSLDNLPSNGHTLQGLVLAFAERVDPALARWIADGCTFPNSMVDRIVPRTTADDRRQVDAQLSLRDAWPVIAEPFFDWAVEDRFAAGRPAWDRGGARFVAEAAPWETLKLRMVNGTHSAIAYLGATAGWHTVDVAIGQAALHAFIEALMRDEIEPTLPALPGLDSAAYRTSLLARFANPALAHRTQQIAMDGSQKLPQRLLGTVRDRLAKQQPIARLGLAIASWLHYLRGRDERGEPYPIDDPLADDLVALARRAEALPDPRARTEMLTRYAPVFGDLAGAPALVAAVAPALESLRAQGVQATLETYR
ncbi:MAG: mannitol dehydrogenase family protein [Burkholderiales bacterium]|nr:MAG: mannitol dehydrogenase family protein [Burkholderiales bacterium]